MLNKNNTYVSNHKNNKNPMINIRYYSSCLCSNYKLQVIASNGQNELQAPKNVKCNESSHVKFNTTHFFFVLISKQVSFNFPKHAFVRIPKPTGCLILQTLESTKNINTSYAYYFRICPESYYFYIHRRLKYRIKRFLNMLYTFCLILIVSYSGLIGYILLFHYA